MNFILKHKNMPYCQFCHCETKPRIKPPLHSFSGTSSKHMWQLLGDGVGAEESRRRDAEPSHRERICKWFSSTRTQICLFVLFQPLTSLLSSSTLSRHHQIKCAQYWPHREEKDVIFSDTNFKLTLVSEDIKSYYTVRQLELENLSVSVSSLQCVCVNVGMLPD